MKTYKQFIKENTKKIPEPPGTLPIPDNHVRLFHQTSANNVEKIEREGIKLDSSTGIEGPKGIWAVEPSETGAGFYGRPQQTPTVEFSMPRDEYMKNFPVILRDIQPHEIIACHQPWHFIARKLIRDNNVQKVKDGVFDSLLKNDDYSDHKEGKYHKALSYVKNL
jgi:hypothetical protein